MKRGQVLRSKIESPYLLNRVLELLSWLFLFTLSNKNQMNA